VVGVNIARTAFSIAILYPWIRVEANLAKVIHSWFRTNYQPVVLMSELLPTIFLSGVYVTVLAGGWTRKTEENHPHGKKTAPPALTVLRGRWRASYLISRIFVVL
jgi:hypothetical protein